MFLIYLIYRTKSKTIQLSDDNTVSFSEDSNDSNVSFSQDSNVQLPED